MSENDQSFVFVDIGGRTNFYSQKVVRYLNCKLISRDEEFFSWCKINMLVSSFKLLHYILNIVKLLYLALFSLLRRDSKIHMIFNIPIYISFETKLIGILTYMGVKCHLILHNDNIHHDRQRSPKTINAFLNSFDTVFVHSTVNMDSLQQRLGECTQLKFSFLPFLYSESLLSDAPLHKLPRCDKAAERSMIKLVFIGSDRPYKNLKLLIKSVSELPKNIQERVQIHVLGPIQPRNKKWAQQCSVNIRFHHSWLSEAQLLEYISRASLVVLPYSESSGSAALTTAFGLGTPYLASDIPFFREFNEHFGGGQLFAFSEAEANLAALIQAYCEGTKPSQSRRNVEKLQLTYYVDQLCRAINKNEQ